MAANIDIKDKKILAELDFNSRQSNAQIAKKVGLSKDSVGYRIKNLEKLKIISGYYAALNVAKLGYSTYKFMLTFRNTDSAIEKGIIEYFKDRGNMCWVVSCDGYYNLMVVTFAKNTFEIDKFFTEFLRRYSQYIKERDAIIITENHSCMRAYLYGKTEDTSPDIYYGGEAEEKLDEVEIKIIEQIADNARMQLHQISNSLNVTGEAIAYRLKQLQRKNIVMAFKPIINTAPLGYQYYNILFRLRRFNNIKKMFAFFKVHPNIIYFVKYLGAYDIGIDLEVKDVNELRKIITQIKNLFSEDIESYTSVLIYQEHKLSYLPK